MAPWAVGSSAFHGPGAHATVASSYINPSPRQSILMDESTRRLWQLAVAAQQHALQNHGIELSADDLAAVDRVLHRERRPAADEQSEMLAACYGAWLGFWTVATLEGAWMGLHEPVAPRVCVGGEVFSPIDAVRRILLEQPGATSVVELAQQARSWRNRAGREGEDHLRQNEHAWDARQDDPRFAAAGGLPSDAEAAMRAIDPWLQAEPIAGREVHCLAAGGGFHGPLHALAGARVTVVDLSERQLEHDRRIAVQLGLELRTLRQSIDQLDQLGDATFDVVVQPVSSCYLPRLEPMYAEIARVLRPGGLYLSQHKQPSSLQSPLNSAGRDGAESGYWIATPLVEGLRLAESDDAADWTREAGTAEFLHGWGALLGGLCASGFVIEAVAEPPRGDALAQAGTPEHRARFLPPYIKLKARRRMT